MSVFESAPSSAAWRNDAARWGRRLVVCSGVAWLAGVAIGFEAVIAVHTAAGFAGLLAGMRIPALGVLSAGLLCTIDPLSRHLLVGDGFLRWNTLNYALIGLAALSWREIARAGDTPLTLLKLLAAVLILQLAWSPDSYLGIQHVLGLLALFGLWACQLRGVGDGSVFYWQGLLCGLQGLLGGLLFNLQRDQLPFINHNVWGLFPLTAMIAVAVALPFAPHRRGTMVLTLLAGGSVTWVFLSSSRGDLLIALTALTFITALIRGTGMRAAAIGLVAVLAVTASMAFSGLQENTWRRIQKLFDDEQTLEGRTSGRSDLVKGGWHIFVQHPFGVGTGGFNRTWASLGYVEGISDFRHGEEFPAHAAWIKVLAENGVFGAVLLVLFVGSFAYAGSRSANPAVRRLGYMTTAVLTAAFCSTEFQGKGFWLLSAATMHLLHGAGQTSPAAARGWREVPVRRLWQTERLT